MGIFNDNYAIVTEKIKPKINQNQSHKINVQITTFDIEMLSKFTLIAFENQQHACFVLCRFLDKYGINTAIDGGVFTFENLFACVQIPIVVPLNSHV